MMSFELQLLIGLNPSINRIHQREKHRHCRQQLFLEQRNLLLPIGVINPGPGYQEPFGDVSGEDPLHGPVAGVQQPNLILRTEPNDWVAIEN
jgi:hypothetical protein